MRAGIVLVHGYTGSPAALRPLAEALARDWGQDAICSLLLHGHGGPGPAAFDREAFVGQILAAMGRFADAGRDVVLIGHSTGGSLALEALARCSVVPRLLVLAAVPHRVRPGQAARWSAHHREPELPLQDIASLVRAIDASAVKEHPVLSPVLLIGAERDGLVLAEELSAWSGSARWQGPVRSAVVPGAGHELFCGPAPAPAVDLVRRAVADALRPQNEAQDRILALAVGAHHGLAGFLSRSPASAAHLAASPCVRRAAGLEWKVPADVSTEPILANIEVTTHCNMACAACARTLRKVEPRHMTRADFGWVLDSLPHAWRVTLVGLGEPLLHPEAATLVADAARRGRDVGLVTNGTMLTAALSRELMDAGLRRLTFSLDTVDPALARDLRPGADPAVIIDHIAAAVAEAQARGRRGEPEPGIAVFCALSSRNAPGLAALAERVADLGVKALMLSDLNFRENAPLTLRQGGKPALQQDVARGVRAALNRGMLALSVRGLEEIDLRLQYRPWLLRRPHSLWQRSPKHCYCVSPWQTISISACGDVCICDCQPESLVGNLMRDGLSGIWNGPAMTEHRRKMTGPTPPAPCLNCPRF